MPINPYVEALPYEDQALMNGISVFITSPKPNYLVKSLLPLSTLHLRKQQGVGSLLLEELSPEPYHAGTSVLDLQPPEL